MASASFEFKFKPSYYTTHGAETLSRKDISELRKEYTRMRDVAQKRIKRLGEEYQWTTSGKQSYEIENEKGEKVTKLGFPKLSEIRAEDLPKAFKDLASFVKWGGSTVSGQRAIQRKTQETLSKAVGEKGAVNSSNYKRVIQILNEARKMKLIYGSDKIVDLANSTMELSQKSFNQVLDHLGTFLEHSEEVEEVFEEYGEPVDMEEFIQEIGW